MKELGITPEFGALLLAALERPNAPPPVPDEVVRRHLDEAGPEFAARVGPEKARVWLGKYDEAAASPSLDSNFYSQWDPNLTGFRKSPARKRVLERIGAPAYWRAHGYPPQCRPVGPQDFSCD